MEKPSKSNLTFHLAVGGLLVALLSMDAVVWFQFAELSRRVGVLEGKVEAYELVQATVEWPHWRNRP